MAALTVVAAVRTGVAFALAAAASGGDTFLNTGKEVLIVNNGSGSSVTLTFDIQGTVDGATITDPTVAVGAGVQMAIGPFKTNLYNNAGGAVSVSYSAVTTVTVGVLQVTAVP